MDKEIKIAYDRGIRAVYRDGYPEFIDSRSPDQNYVWSSLDNWIALRAYQDDQRKKGVPIVLPDYPVVEWYNRDYGSHGINYMFYARNTSPVIKAFKQTMPGNGIAMFTNFRWREGYPKHGGMANVKVLGGGVVELLKNNQ